MATLHINNVRGPLALVFRGMFGAIQEIPNEPDSVLFTYDPAIAACSNSLSAVGMSRSMKLQKNEVATIEGSDGAINAIKANLAQGLIRRWERGYAQVLGSAREAGAGGLASELSLRATGGDPVASEREVARTGIARLMSTMSNIAPHWVQADQQLWIGPNLDNEVVIEAAGVANIDMQAAPIPMESWSEAAPFEPIDPGGEHDGWFDAKIAIPVYLPVAQMGTVARLMQQIGFGRSSDLTREQVALNEETLGLIQTTYLLREMVIDSRENLCVDGQSLVEVVVASEQVRDRG